MAAKVRAVFFDLGGTLFSYRDLPRLSAPLLAEAAQRLGVEEKPDIVGAAYGRAVRSANEPYLDRPYYLHRDIFFDTYRAFTRALGVAPAEDFYEWIYSAQHEMMTTQVTLRADCLDTLKALRELGLSMAIVSNIDDDYLDPLVANFGLAPLLDHWSSSEEARSCKPDRGIFELALRKSGVRPEEVVFVGDSRHHDVRGARQLGMSPVLIDERRDTGLPDRDDHTPESTPDHVIRELNELVAWVGARAR